MAELDMRHLTELSLPVFDGFARVEPKPWDRQAVLLELLGELGSLGHVAQRLEGFRRGEALPAKLADECCDVVFIAIRLARDDGVALPERIAVPDVCPDRPSALILSMCRDLAALSEAPGAKEHLIGIIGAAAAVAASVGVDFTIAYEREMAVAAGFFAACGDDWPHPQPMRRPLATLRLWRLLWRRHSSPPR